MLTLFLLCLYIFNFEIMSPSIISTGMFTISTGVAVLNVRSWNIEYSLMAFILLTTGVLTIVLIEIIVRKIFRNNMPKNINKNNCGICLRHMDNKVSILIIIFCTLALLLYIRAAINLANGSASIFGGSIFFRLNQFSKRSLELGLEGGIGTINIQLGKIIQMFVYIYLFKLINNLVYGETIKRNIDSVYMIVLYIILVIFQGTRTPLINLLIFSFLLFYIKILQKRNWMFKKKEGRNFFKKALIIILIGIPAFFFFGENVLGRHTGNNLWQYISAYLGGSIQHFNQYVIEPIEPNLHFAEETFVYLYQGLYKLGLTEYTRTVHLEYRWLSTDIHGNVYTFFRRPLQDFGVLGMYIYTCIVFFIFSSLYYAKIRNRSASFKNDIALFFIIYIYQAVVYVSIESSGFSNLISIGNLVFYIGMIICFRFAFCIKIKNK